MGGNNKKHTMTGTKSKNPTSEQISLLSSDDEDIVYTTVLSAPQHGRRSKYKNLYQLSPHSDIEKNLAATEQHRPSQYGSPHLDEYEVEDETRSPYSCGCSWWLVVLLVVLVLAVLASATVLIYYEVVRDRQDEDQSQLPLLSTTQWTTGSTTARTEKRPGLDSLSREKMVESPQQLQPKHISELSMRCDIYLSFGGLDGPLVIDEDKERESLISIVSRTTTGSEERHRPLCISCVDDPGRGAGENDWDQT